MKSILNKKVYLGIKTIIIIYVVFSVSILYISFINYNEYFATITTIVMNMWLIIPVILLLMDKNNEKNPILKISFELVRSTLACLKFQNLGKVDLELLSFKVNEEFIPIIPDKNRIAVSSLNNTQILITSGQSWILNLGITITDVINSYASDVVLSYEYRKVGKDEIYKDKMTINFKNYSHFMVYISEMDEINSTLKDIVKETKVVKTELVKTTRLLSNYVEYDVVKKEKKDGDNI